MRGKIIILSLILILIGVVSYLISQLQKISKAALTFSGVKLKSITLNKIDLVAYFKTINEGTASVTISEQEYDVFLNGKYVSHMRSTKPITIKPGENILPFDVTIGLSDILKAGWANLGQILTDKSKINITIKGTRDMRIGFIPIKNIAINETFNLGEMN
jgi:LEA14-like dessication related protein